MALTDLTFTQLRQALGFGVVRLKLLLAIRREPCLDAPGFEGRFVAHIGRSGQVKAHTLPPEPIPAEVRLEEPTG